MFVQHIAEYTRRDILRNVCIHHMCVCLFYCKTYIVLILLRLWTHTSQYMVAYAVNMYLMCFCFMYYTHYNYTILLSCFMINPFECIHCAMMIVSTNVPHRHHHQYMYVYIMTSHIRHILMYFCVMYKNK